MAEDIQVGCNNSLEDQRLITTQRIVRIFHPTTIAAIASGKFLLGAHAKVTGKVLVVRAETDGDTHVRLSDGVNFIICEIIPELPKPAPVVGSTITVWGIVRYDSVHKWWEIHPVIGWSAKIIVGAIADISALVEIPTSEETDESA